MKAYVYERVEAITENWHDGGGLLIITDRGPAKAWREFVKGKSDEITRALPKPDLVFATSATKERVIVFPDSGCC